MNQRKIFSTIGWAYFLLAAVTIVLQLLLSLALSKTGVLSGRGGLVLLLSAAPMYLVGMPICVKVLGRIPKKQLFEHTMKAGKWFLYLCICLFIMYAGNIIGNGVCAVLTKVFGFDMAFDLQQMLTSESLLVTFVFSVILAPILEELVFRKALIDRAIVFGDKTVILLSGFLFGFFHGNFNQLFYAFGLGCFFAYLYIRTGKIKYTISLHMAVNFLGGFLPAAFLKGMNFDMFMGGTDLPGADVFAYLLGNMGLLLGYVIYIFCMFGAGIAGLVLFLISVRKADLRPGAYTMSRGDTARAMFGNIGMILFCAVCVILFATNMA